MPTILIAFAAFALATLSQIAAAAAWEETFLVMQTDSGTLVNLEYSSEGKDEQKGIRRYRTYSPDKRAKTTECSYRDADNPRKLRCTTVGGKRANRIYRERARPSGALAGMAHQIYTNFVGKRLPSSVGELHQEMFVCATGCSKEQMSVAIWISCAECGMEEDWCYRRQEPKPKLATVSTDEVNLRAEPALKSQVVDKLRFNQTIRLMEARSACAEIETKEGVRVGRWIKVKENSTSRKAEGWLFDIYVTYDTEKQNNSYPGSQTHEAEPIIPPDAAR
jgi:hypothetical protein